MFKRLHEDNVLGRINNEQLRMLSCGYSVISAIQPDYNEKSQRTGNTYASPASWLPD